MNFDYTGAFDVLGSTGGARNDDHAPTYNGSTFSWTTTDVVDTGATVTCSPSSTRPVRVATTPGGAAEDDQRDRQRCDRDGAGQHRCRGQREAQRRSRHGQGGTSATTYTATLTDGDTDKSGNVVYWVLTPGAGTSGPDG